MNVEFKYTQILTTKHPFFDVTVVFEVEAEVKNEIVIINSIRSAAHTTSGSTAWQKLAIPTVNSMFAGLLREKAREAAAKWKQENF